MDLTIKWEKPTVPSVLRASIEANLAIALKDADFLKAERASLVVNFVPAIPVNSALVATIVETRLGKLIGVVEAPSDGQSITVVPFLP